MLLTVTLNTAIDRVLLIDRLQPGLPVNARKEVICVGGKGLDASVALSGLKVANLALSFMAGQNGRTLEEIVKGYGIDTQTVWVDGETRLNYVVAEDANGRVTHIKLGGLLVQPEHVQELLAQYARCLSGVSYVILAGSIPSGVSPDVMLELTRLAHASSVPVLIDSHDVPNLQGQTDLPDILKQNRDEFCSTFGVSAQTPEELSGAARSVRAEYSLKAVVITCGKDGIVAVRAGESCRVEVPTQPALNSAGAGDAASAALAWRLSEGDEWTEALQWSGAVSAAAVLTEATGEVRLADVERLWPLIRVAKQE